MGIGSGHQRPGGCLKHRIHIDHEFDESRPGYVVRVLLTLHAGAPAAGQAPDPQAPGAAGPRTGEAPTACARNVAVELLTAPAAQLVRHHCPCPATLQRDRLHVAVGDLPARESTSLLVELFVPGPGEMLDVPLASLTIHAQVRAADGQTLRRELLVRLAATLRRAGYRDPVVREELSRRHSARTTHDA